MAMELKHLNPQHVMDVTGKAIDEISRLRAENAELQAENERLKKCEIWMKQHFYCEEVIACESAKNRRLKRALWLARAERAKEFRYKIKFAISSMNTKYNYSDADKWAKVERKCRAKAEKYK